MSSNTALISGTAEPDDEIARVGMVTPADPNRFAFWHRHSVYVDPHGRRRPSGEDEGGIEQHKICLAPESTLEYLE